jgi:hypothetical protein
VSVDGLSFPAASLEVSPVSPTGSNGFSSTALDPQLTGSSSWLDTMPPPPTLSQRVHSTPCPLLLSAQEQSPFREGTTDFESQEEWRNHQERLAAARLQRAVVHPGNLVLGDDGVPLGL